MAPGMSWESPCAGSSAQLSRLRAQIHTLQGLNGLLLCALGLAIGSLAVASALPQKREREVKQRELERIRDKEARVIIRKEDKAATYRALREDPEFLELHARDRLNLHRPGETIYRIERQR